MVVPEVKHFMRTKYNALAGPDGGDGGRGGHIILRGNKNTWTLLPLRYYKNVLAENGESGSGNNCTGRFGKDIYIDVPLGTIARDELSGLKEAEILEDGQEIIWLKGGRGGLGNARFATPTNQAPEHAQPGEPGVEGWKVLGIKSIGRCRPCWFSKCRQINLIVGHDCSHSQNCGLCIYNPGAAIGYGGIPGWKKFLHCRPTRNH